MRSHPLSIRVALFVAMVFTASLVAAANPNLSNRTFVDTRDPTDGSPNPLLGNPKFVDSSQTGGRRLLSYEMASQSLTRPETGNVTVYLQLNVPDFIGKTGGWGANSVGLGTFYGLEMKTLSRLAPVDTLQYKIGGEVPSSKSPATGWKPVAFDSIIDIPLKKETYYFKIVLAAGASGVGGVNLGPLTVSARFKSARLCRSSGGPVTELNAGASLWVLSHGKIDGENSFRSMNNAVSQGTGGNQVVNLDWASGADGSLTDLSSGRYFINLGRNLAGHLKEKGFSRSNTHWVGHSWGALVGCETARALGQVNRFIALDPATQAFGGYSDGRVNFGTYSAVATGVKGGTSALGTFGSESKTRTCDYAIRLYSSNLQLSPSFYHSLPRAWFKNAMQTSSDPYWSSFQAVILRASTLPRMPWGSSQRLSPWGFDLECYGTTRNEKGMANFVSHDYLRFRSSLGVITRARLKKNVNGTISWY